MDLSSLNAATPTGAITGEMGFGDLNALRKALEAGYGTDVAALTGGGALRIQSLDTTLQATLADNAHFRLFNALSKTDASATVDEWTEATDQGGFTGGSANGELDTIAQAQGVYARRAAFVKYLMTRCEVSFVQTLQNAIVQAEAQENQMGTLRLLRDVEHLCFEGDSTVVPSEFDGIITQIESLNSADHILDAEAQSLASIDLVNKGAATIVGIGNYGVPTDLFMSPLVQADFDTGLDPAFRVSLSGTGQDIMLGAPVKGIRTSWGDIRTNHDVFIRDENQQTPFAVRYSAVAAANAANVPDSVTAAMASDASSKFGAAHAGNYYYAVAAVNKNGESTLVKSSQTAVSAGEKVTLTITSATGGTETGYAIYRSAKNGGNANSDFRLVKRIAKSAGATTTFVDYNRDIPGTSKAYILNLSPGHHAITWRKLLPLTKFALYPTNAAVVPWALLMFGFLRISKRNQHIVIKNVLPNGAVWRPFG
jgi:hypothetical protein